MKTARNIRSILVLLLLSAVGVGSVMAQGDGTTPPYDDELMGMLNPVDTNRLDENAEALLPQKSSPAGDLQSRNPFSLASDSSVVSENFTAESEVSEPLLNQFKEVAKPVLVAAPVLEATPSSPYGNLDSAPGSPHHIKTRSVIVSEAPAGSTDDGSWVNM